MNFSEYQQLAHKTAIYPTIGHTSIYPILGLMGEAGELCNYVKKIFRDRDGKFTMYDINAIEAELGDILWYVAEVASCMGSSLDAIARHNTEKLQDRQERGVLGGSGDNR